jgi:HD-GYP domain-containing protein (c-di-GMP phosphodiesterase class II)
VKGGLRRIDIEKELPVYSVGALLYDIGKIPFAKYHDSNDGYDANIVKMHVLVGYNMILKTKKYQFVIAAMAAFHHEYYGGKGSYEFTNPILSKYNQKKRTDEKAQYFITYDEKEFRDGLALSLFPCKIIEIIDVYNALIYKKNSHFEAMKIIKKNFITQSLKVDPLIFDIFLEFKHKCGLINAEERKEIDAIIY